MIEVFKMIHSIHKVNIRKLFCIYEDRRTRKQIMFKNEKPRKLKYRIENFH